MSIPVDLWHSAISLLLVTLVSSTVMLSAALLLVPRVKALSASLRCRIWLLSLIACFLPAMMLASVPMFRAGGPYSWEVSAAAVETGNVSKSKTTELTRPASEVNTIEVKSGEDFVENATKVVIAPDSKRGQNRAASVETVTSDHFNTIESAAIETLASGTNATKPATQFSFKIPTNVSRTVVITWLSISLFLMIRLLANISRTAMVWGRPTQAPMIAEQPHRRIAAMLEGFGENNAIVPIQISEAVIVPVVVGLFHPMIVLPAEVAQWPDGQLNLVLQHELAHVRRRDIFWNCFVSVVNSIIWFQPLAWIAKRKLRDDQEFACDDAVLLQGNGASEYAAMLVNVAESLLIRRQCPVSSVAMAGCCSVERRIHAILDTSKRRSESPRQKFTWITGVAMIMLLVAATCNALKPEFAFAGQTERDSAESEQPQLPAPVATINENKVGAGDAVQRKTNASVPTAVSHKLRGRVIDENGDGMSGATVSAEGRDVQSLFAKTDADGWYEIEVTSSTVFSHMPIFLRATVPSNNNIWIGRCVMESGHLTAPTVMNPTSTMTQIVRVNDGQQPIADAFVGVLKSNVLVGLWKTDKNGVASVQRLLAGCHIFALKDNMGFDAEVLESIDPTTSDEEAIALCLKGARPRTFRLMTQGKFQRTISAAGLISETEYLEPLAGVRVVPTSMPVSGHLFTMSQLLDYPVADAICPRSNAAGEVTINWLPNWTSAMFQIEVAGNGLASEQHTVEVEDNDEIPEIKIDRLVEIRGRVVDREGKPVAAAVVQARGRNWDPNSPFQNENTGTSDAEGNYSMFVAARQELVLHAEMRGNISRSERHSIVPLQSPLNIELKFSGTNRISGMLTSGPNQTPLPGRLIEFYEMNRPDEVFGRDIAAQNADMLRQVAIDFEIRTDEHGRYDLQLADGEWYIYDPFDRQKNVSFKINGGFQVQKDFHSDGMTLLRTKVISAATQEEVDGVAYISGVTQPHLNAGYHLVSRKPHMVEVSSSAGKAFTVWDGQSDEMQIFVAPVVTASGQLVDDKGMRLPDRSIRYMILPSIPAGTQRTKEFSYGNSGQIETDQHGKFTLSNFIQGCECQVMATNDEGIEWAKQRWTVLKAVVPTTDDPIDLGQLKISASMSVE